MGHWGGKWEGESVGNFVVSPKSFNFWKREIKKKKKRERPMQSLNHC